MSKQAVGHLTAQLLRANRRAGEELDRQCLRLRSLGVQCTTDGKGIYLTDPESMIGALTAYRTAADYLSELLARYAPPEDARHQIDVLTVRPLSDEGGQ